MKIQTIPFPNSPEEALAKVREVQPLLAKFFAERKDGSVEALPAELLVIMWHQWTLDFIEILDGEKRVGLAMTNLFFNEQEKVRYATLTAAYIEPEYRGKGEFKRLLKYMQTVYQARRVKSIDVQVPLGVNFSFGEPRATMYRIEV